MTEMTCPECDSSDIDMSEIEWECEACGYTHMQV